jgi:hypothetical protein
MKVFVYASELWPFFVWREPTVATEKHSLDVSEETLQRWADAKDAFLRVQDEIRSELGKADLLDKVM